MQEGGGEDGMREVSTGKMGPTRCQEDAIQGVLVVARERRTIKLGFAVCTAL